MKKVMLITAIALISANANATPYLGVGLNQSNVKYSNGDINLSNGEALKDVNKDDYLSNKMYGVNLFGGYEFNNNIFVEGSYTSYAKGNESKPTGLYWSDSGNEANVVTEVKLNTLDADFGYTYKFNKFGLFGATGLSYLMYEEKEKFKDQGTTKLTASESENSFGLNAKIGCEYRFDNTLSLRTEVKYINPLMDNIDRIYNYNIGAKFTY